MDAAGLAAQLADFCQGEIALQRPGELDLTPWQAPAATIPPLWRVSYSAVSPTTGG